MDARAGGKHWLTVAGAAVLAVFIAGAVVLAVLYAFSPRSTKIAVGDRAPGFSLPALTADVKLRFEPAGAGPALLVFFDTRWPSTAEYLPRLERMYRGYLRRGLRMTAVSFDTDRQAAQKFVRESSITFELMSDPDAAEITKLFGAPRDPEAYLLDAQGRVERVFTDFIDPKDPATKEALERHLVPAPHGF